MDERPVVDLRVNGSEGHRHRGVVKGRLLRPIHVRHQADVPDALACEQALRNGKQILRKAANPALGEPLVAIFDGRVIQAARGKELYGQAAGHHAGVVVLHEPLVALEQGLAGGSAHAVGEQVALIDEFHILVDRAGFENLVK